MIKNRNWLHGAVPQSIVRPYCFRLLFTSSSFFLLFFFMGGLHYILHSPSPSTWLFACPPISMIRDFWHRWSQSGQTSPFTPQKLYAKFQNPKTPFQRSRGKNLKMPPVGHGGEVPEFIAVIAALYVTLSVRQSDGRSGAMSFNDTMCRIQIKE